MNRLGEPLHDRSLVVQLGLGGGNSQVGSDAGTEKPLPGNPGGVPLQRVERGGMEGGDPEGYPARRPQPEVGANQGGVSAVELYPSGFDGPGCET